MQKGKLFYCDHCSKLTAPSQLTTVLIQGTDRHFCCPGCELSWKILRKVGYDDFYNLQRKELGIQELDGTLELSPEEQENLDTLTREFVKAEGPIRSVFLKIEKIHCAACVFANEEIVRNLPGVLEFTINPATHRSRIRWDNRKLSLADILNTISGIGYYAYPFNPVKEKPSLQAETRDLITRLGASGFLSMNVMLISVGLYAGYFQGIDPVMRAFLQWINLILTIPGVFYAGKPILAGAWQNLKAKSPGMDLLIATGTLSAFFLSLWNTVTGIGETYYDTANMLIFFILLGRLVETRAKQVVLKETDKYDEFRIETVTMETDGIRVNCSINQVKQGDRLVFAPGDRVPVDGVVITGRSAFDESLLTGESVPVEKGPGDSVVSGTRNLQTEITMEVSSVGEGTVLSRLMELIESSQLTKSPISRFVDRLSGAFIYLILVLAAITFLWYFFQLNLGAAVLTGIAVLVIACPCAMGIATPMAVLVGNSEALRRGILIKSSEILENLPRIDTIVFDKTGTLTTGIMEVKKLHWLTDSAIDKELLQKVAWAETEVYHPVARAIRSWGLSEFGSYLPAGRVETIPGRGVCFDDNGNQVLAGNELLIRENNVPVDSVQNLISEISHRGRVPVLIASQGKLLYCLEIADSIRTETPAVLKKLKEKGYSIRVVSGDRPEAVSDLATTLGLLPEDVYAGQTPDMKLALLSRWKEEGKRILMIGDGLNDAPSLAAADVGIAMGEGNRITLDNSGVILLKNQLESIPKSLEIARQTVKKIRQNLFWALVYNVVMIPLAMTGILIPIYAAGAMSASSISVVLNSLALRWKKFS